MNFTLMPSLEHRALVKIAVALWSRSDIKDLVARFHTYEWVEASLKKWQSVEKKVKEKVPQLPLPEKLKNEVLDFIRPIAQEILKWKEYHDQNFGIDQDRPVELFWTPQGTVERKKTAEVLVKDENIDIITRYTLACIYCLEDDMKELWNSMPQRKKEFICIEDYPSCFQKNGLTRFWTNKITGEPFEFNDMIKRISGGERHPYQLALACALVYGSKAAAEYFLQKLTVRERDDSLVKFANRIAQRRRILFGFTFVNDSNPDHPIHHADILCFSLSQMDEEQQSILVEGNPAGLLSHLLCWPWQSFFMETANRVWNFLPEANYELLLHLIVNNIKKGYKDYNYRNLFAEFWQQSPNTYKKYVISKCDNLLKGLLKAEDKENVRLIVKSATVKEREEIIFHDEGKDICMKLIYKNKWDLLKFFVRACISSEDSMIKFKEEFRKHIKSHLPKQRLEREKDMWTNSFQFLDDLFHKHCEKRGMEEESSSGAVKILKFI